MPNLRTSTSITPRVLRVFVSSTFSDMQEERDELAKFVFPELRKLCEERGVVWGDVDLRWGVTDEQRAEGKVLPICLEEIHDCQVFVGLLGERYGWIPEDIPETLTESQAWLKEHREHSVTALEIEHGVLCEGEKPEHCYFYFRDPAYVASLPKDRQTASREVDPHRQAKLVALKARLRERVTPAPRDYPHPKALGKLVLADLSRLVDTLFPRDEKLDPLDRDAAEHEAFAEVRRRVYIGEDRYFARLNEHAASDGPPLVILGESGSGKSALLANWVAEYRARHPDDLVITHSIGATPYSTDWAAMLRRIMGEFRRRFGVTEEIPDKPDELRMAFANSLHMAAARGRVVIILDGLNQLEDRDQAPDLVWLPPVIPGNVRLFLSTLPGRSLDDLTKRDWPTLHVELLTPKERSQFIKDYLRQYGKALSDERAQRVAGAPSSANPLYLRVLLEELRLFGSHERLDERITYYLSAQTVPDLYGLILTRWEADYGEGTSLVHDSMSLIWAARRGLSESELLEILGKDGQPLPRAVWSPLYLAARDALVSRSGLLGFAHEFLREAVREKYLPTSEHERAARLKVADYFAARDISPRKVDELPWQLSEAKEWRRLYDLLANLTFFDAAWAANEWEVKAYWSQVEQNSPLRLADAFHVLTSAPDGSASGLHRLEFLLRHAGHPTEAMVLLRAQEIVSREQADKRGLAYSLGNQALILRDRGDHQGAIALMKEAERFCREPEGDKNYLQKCLCDQATALYLHGDSDAAMALLKEAERPYREQGDRAGLACVLSNQALILRDRGDHQGAMALMKEAEQICRELGNKDGLQTNLGNQASVHWIRGDLDGAMALMKEQERLCRQFGNKCGLQLSLGNQALVLQGRGDLDGAVALLKEQERLCRHLGNKHGLQASLGNQAVVLRARGDLDGAMALMKEQERLCRELGNKDGLQVSLGNQAVILQTRGDLDGAMALLKEQERLCRELDNKDKLQPCLGNQATVLRIRGDRDGAMALLKEQEHICREIGEWEGLAKSLADQALILMQTYRRNEALEPAEQALDLAERHNLAALAERVRPFLNWLQAQDQ